jgi:GTP pyrophosphokinase
VNVAVPQPERTAGPLPALLAEASPLPAPEAESLDDALASLRALGSDEDVLLATALHALGEAVPEARRAEILRAHPGVGPLLEGQNAAAQVWALHAEAGNARNQEGLRRLLLAMVQDLRVVPILLARQLARMRRMDALDPAQRQAMARLTRDLHAPLANRLGIWQLKWELEDLAFRALEPETYQRIARLLDDNRGGRERYIAEVRAQLAAALAAHGIDAEVAGRPKHIYSIWRKMQKKGVPIGELYDLRALRVLVADVAACYAALGVVHALWTPVPGEFDDYIARPKRNDYRSLHTAVIGPAGKTVEVQIRTREMHRQAELGVAAHWRYKEGRVGNDEAMSRRIEWMRQLLEAGAEAMQGGFESELAEDRVYALTPKGEVVDLPAGATPLDFAYHVHTEVGHRCQGAKVNGRIVPLQSQLRSGDRVEILTAKTAAPRRDWLVAANGFLASPRSREKVRAWFHKLDRARNVQAGRELLEKELRRLGLLQHDLSPVLPKFNVASVEDLQVLVALGDVGPSQVSRALLDLERAPEPESPALRQPRRVAKAKPAQLTVVGVDNLVVQVARCCQPLPGEAISGYLTRGRGVSVHRADCPALLRLAARQPQRVLPVEWGSSAGAQDVAVTVDGVDRKALLKDLADTIAQADAHVGDLHAETLRGGRVRIRIRLRVPGFEELSRLLGKLERLPGVERARRG